jgi:hypothetical protein
MKIELGLKIKEKEEDYNIETMNLDSHKALTEVEQHKVLFSEESSALYSSTRPEANYDYDYEVNNVRFGEENDQEYLYIKKESPLLGIKYVKIDPSTELYDSLNIPYDGNQSILNPMGVEKKAKANIFKRLVSKKKRRLQTEYYDLDMAYITERVIGMGFPAYGCEKFYRNTLEDTKAYLDRYHKVYKIYNLCIEKDRIYPKTYFEDSYVGLFPFNDHSPCPCKLILDFCVDICLFLSAHPDGVAAIHCKAGKGRTGVMIVCYLIFSGLCKNTEEALVHYANQRTLNKKGVTIASQIRYIKYFETFLSSNYEKPFLKCIPKIVKFDLNKRYTNMLINYNVDMSYFTTINSFKLKNCLIGPFSQEMFLTHQFSAITRKKLNFLNSKIKKELRENGWYYIIEINSDELINYDLKLTIKGKKISFYSWFNLWYATFEIISKYVIENNYFEDDNITRYSNINSALSEINTNEINKSKNNEILNSSRISERSHFNESGGQSIMTITLTKMKAKHKYGLKRKSAIQTLKNNKDLNNICDGIDDLAKEKKVELLDRKNLVFTIGRKQLDKLKAKKNNDNFEVKYCYELVN